MTSKFSTLRRCLLAVVFICCAMAAQAAPASFSVRHVLGLEAIHKNANCSLTIQGDDVVVEAGAEREQFKAEKIQDLFTNADSERIVRGALQVLSLAVPFGGSRFLSLFRRKVDTLTVEYRDENGALHGAILTMKPGEAVELKKQLLDAGAHTSMPLGE